jgi:predicted CxxxxCH...CXXCH cytochrome family protein
LRNLHAACNWLAAAALLAACGEARKPVNPQSAAGATACGACHGSADSAAPPRSVGGATATTDRAVGAHQSHVRAGPMRGALACEECHPARPSISAPGHLDGKVDVAFGALASLGTVPAWSGATCAVYCHGATLAGGSVAAPTWTRVDGTQAACGACHGLPPPTLSKGGAHPAVAGGITACAGCHPQTVKADGTIDVAAGKHIDGAVQGPSGGGTCTSCHGDASRQPSSIAPAPPRDTAGNTATTARGVGAHQSHLAAGPLAGAIACSECHVYPPVGTHPSGAVDLAFGPLASTGTTAAWNGATCAVYCHGATLAGGSVAAPTWTRVDGTQAACGACHGLPPPTVSGGGAHPAVAGGVTACAGCHPQTVKADGTIDVAGGKHVDGTVEVQGAHPAGWSDPTQHGHAANADLATCKGCHGASLTGGTVGVSCDSCHTGGTAAWRTTCTFCHGDPARATAVPENRFAPPLGTQGETLPSQPAVGAHQRHLGGSANSAPVACTECHAVGAIADITHVDGVVGFAWGPLATHGGAAPAYNGASCSASYCHGSFPGGASASPAWIGSAMTCTSCHGNAPATGQHQRSPHVSAGCAACHGTGYSSTTARAADHPNGVKNVGGAGSQLSSWNPATRTCVGCHGSAQW